MGNYEDLPPFDTSRYEPFDPARSYVGYSTGYNEIIDILGAWPVPYVALPAVEHEASWNPGMLHVSLPDNRPDLAPYYRWGGWAESVSLPGYEDDEEE